MKSYEKKGWAVNSKDLSECNKCYDCPKPCTTACRSNACQEILKDRRTKGWGMNSKELSECDNCPKCPIIPNPNCVVEVYEHGDFKGSSKKFTSTTNLDDNWKNKISSAKVRGCGRTQLCHGRAENQSTCLTLEDGDHSSMKHLNDGINSIKI